MKLSNKKVSVIIVLITIALTGLVLLQTILLNTALKAEEETFKSNVILALNKVSNNLTSFEARDAILKIAIDDSTFNGQRRIVRSGVFNDSINDSVVVFHNSIGKPDDSQANYYKYLFNEISPDHDEVTTDSSYEVTMIFSDTLIKNPTLDQIGYFENTKMVSIGGLGGVDSARILLIEAVLGQLDMMEVEPVEKRIDTLILDSAIEESFRSIHLDLEYTLAITNIRSDSIIYSKGEPLLEQIADSPYRALLFPNDHISPLNYLVVNFPNKQFYIYSKLLSLILPTIFFLLIIISCFIYSIKMILSQRKTSVRLTDFINNMTHEFKTPISTIHLASEAIGREDVLSNREKMNKYNNMIQSENKRMKNQVDKILQIATLEEGDYILNREDLDLHKLTEEAADTFSIMIKQTDGSVIKNLEADNSMIRGDRVHVLNVISNLIDNAIKYSKRNPKISITTVNKGSAVELSIKDNGIGIHPDDTKFVFNKYYRVSNGDIHNIKGFGLGLSYVKMMVEAHNGSVEILSALDKGTEVLITLPLK